MADPDHPSKFLNAGQEAIIRHWTTYGQRGTTPTRRATPFDWDRKPFVAPEAAKWHVPLKPHQVPLLLLGFIPADPPDAQAMAASFQVGETITTHGFMSSSQNPKLKASEDKWFIYADGPDANGQVNLHMMRSWSGDKMLELRFNAGKIQEDGLNSEEASITDIIWESDPSMWQNMDERQAKEIASEVCRWVLAVDFNEELSFMPPAASFDLLTEALLQLPPMGEQTVYSQR